MQTRTVETYLTHVCWERETQRLWVGVDEPAERSVSCEEGEGCWAAEEDQLGKRLEELERLPQAVSGVEMRSESTSGLWEV